MVAYFISKCTIRDMDALKPYIEECIRLSKVYPHEVMARDTRVTELEGSPHREQHYMHRFPSYEAALEFYNSPEYQAVIPIRLAACDGCECVILEGGDNMVFEA